MTSSAMRDRSACSRVKDRRSARLSRSSASAGGCFAFRAIRWIDGKRTTITGVVLGQPGYDRIAAGLAAADATVDRIAGHRAVRQRWHGPLPSPRAPQDAHAGIERSREPAMLVPPQAGG